MINKYPIIVRITDKMNGRRVSVKKGRMYQTVGVRDFNGKDSCWEIAGGWYISKLDCRIATNEEVSKYKRGVRYLDFINKPKLKDIPKIKEGDMIQCGKFTYRIKYDKNSHYFITLEMVQDPLITHKYHRDTMIRNIKRGDWHLTLGNPIYELW